MCSNLLDKRELACAVALITQLIKLLQDYSPYWAAVNKKGSIYFGLCSSLWLITTLSLLP